ncbi:MAG: hypothetical protein WAN57_08590, partial [Smithella sp.]
EQTRKILTTLTSREEKVLRMRFGISDRSNFLTTDENLSVDAVEKITEITEVPEVIEDSQLKKVKNKSKKRYAKS